MCRGNWEHRASTGAYVEGKDPVSLFANRDSLLRWRKEPPLPHLAGMFPAPHPQLRAYTMAVLI